MKRPAAIQSHRVSAPVGARLIYGHRAATAKSGGQLGRQTSHRTGRQIDNSPEASNRSAAPRIAVIDGPYNAAALFNVLARRPINLSNAVCGVRPSSACRHGTFIMGLLGARNDASIPGLCPAWDLVHIGLFADADAAQTSVPDLALAINDAVTSGASLINLSLALLGDGGPPDKALLFALDRAEAAGVIVMAAAGNQRRLTASQILSHPVTIPVAAMDAAGHLLPDCNFGPLISRRGVAALGHQLLGYALDGGVTVMSGTSVATAVATGIVAQVWSARPYVDGATIRTALAGLARRDEPVPPRLVAADLLAKLDQIVASRSAETGIALQSDRSNSLRLRGGSVMSDDNGPHRVFPSAGASYPGSGDAVAPAHGSSGCGCSGASSGSCTCSNGGTSPSRLVYVLGTVDCRFPDQSVSDEFQAAADTLGIEQGEQSLRSWVHQVLDDPRAKPGLRYIARQMCWVLTVERQPAYYLTLCDWQDLDDLIACLGEPDEPDGCDLVLIAGSSSLIPVETSPGVLAPLLQVEQICAYKLEQLISWCEVPLPTRPPASTSRRGAAQASTTPAPADLFNSFFKRIVQTADNFGDSDECRVLNYLAVRCKPLYQLYSQKVASGEYLLDSVRVIPSRLRRDRRIFDPVFSFVQKNSGALEKYFLRVDVTYLFPFVVTSLRPDKSGAFVPNYFDH